MSSKQTTESNILHDPQMIENKSDSDTYRELNEKMQGYSKQYVQTVQQELAKKRGTIHEFDIMTEYKVKHPDRNINTQKQIYKRTLFELNEYRIVLVGELDGQDDNTVYEVKSTLTCF